MTAVQIILPMAGDGTRFGAVGERRPKPLIEIAGKPMFFWALENLPVVSAENPVRMVIRKDHIKNFPEFGDMLSNCQVAHQVCEIAGPTPSPLHTIAQAADFLDPEEPVLILNCDQYLAEPIDEEIASFLGSTAAAAAFTLETSSPDYIHLAVNRSGEITEVLGRGSFAAPSAAGLYLFRSAGLLFSCIQSRLGSASSREPCVTDLLEWLIGNGQLVQALPLGSPGERFHSLGTPALVGQFASHPINS